MTEPVPTEPRVVLAEPMENLIRSLRAEIEYRKTVEVDLRAELERTREVVAAAKAWRKSMQPVIAGGQLPGTRPQTRALVVAVDALRTDNDRSLPVLRCGQLSTHAPHVVNHGPDQPRNCSGVPSVTADALRTDKEGADGQ